MRRRIQGGLDIIPVKDSEFKYTVDPQRIIWTKNVYPISQYLLPIIQNIPWNSYRFEGETTLSTEIFYNSNNEFNMAALNNELAIEQHKVNVIATTDGIKPYAYFGGCVYEILNTKYQKITNLRSFVDPTGDIDVVVCMPKIIPPTHKEYKDYHYIRSKKLSSTNGVSESKSNVEENNKNISELTITEVVDSYTKWIFNEFEKNLTNIPKPLFNGLFENTIECDYNDAKEGVIDISKKIGNLWIVRSINIPGNMIKIQLVCKFKDMEHPEHLIEFVLHLDTSPSVDELNNNIVTLKKTLYEFGSFPIMNFSELIKGNIDTSLENRISFWNTPLRHKFYNHVGRIQYLNNLLPRLVKRPGENVTNSVGKIEIGDSQYYTLVSYIMNLIELLIKVKNRGDICKYDYKYVSGACNEIEIINGLVGGLSTMIFKQTPPGSKLPYMTTSIKVNGKGRLAPLAALELLYTPLSAANSSTATKGGKRSHTRRHKHRRHRPPRKHRTRKRA